MIRHFAALFLKALAAANLFAMMGVTVVDVLGRYLIDQPLQGSFEMTEIMMGILVFSVLPLVTADDDHITISLFDRWFRGRGLQLKQAAIALFSGAFIGTAAWRVWLEAGRMSAYQDRTAFLEVPLWPLAYFMSLMMAVTLLVLIVLAVVKLTARPER